MHSTFTLIYTAKCDPGRGYTWSSRLRSWLIPSESSLQHRGQVQGQRRSLLASCGMHPEGVAWMLDNTLLSSSPAALHFIGMTGELVFLLEHSFTTMGNFGGGGVGINPWSMTCNH